MTTATPRIFAAPPVVSSEKPGGLKPKINDISHVGHTQHVINTSTYPNALVGGFAPNSGVGDSISLSGNKPKLSSATPRERLVFADVSPVGSQNSLTLSDQDTDMAGSYDSAYKNEVLAGKESPQPTICVLVGETNYDKLTIKYTDYSIILDEEDTTPSSSSSLSRELESGSSLDNSSPSSSHQPAAPMIISTSRGRMHLSGSITRTESDLDPSPTKRSRKRKDPGLESESTKSKTSPIPRINSPDSKNQGSLPIITKDAASTIGHTEGLTPPTRRQNPARRASGGRSDNNLHFPLVKSLSLNCEEISITKTENPKKDVSAGKSAESPPTNTFSKNSSAESPRNSKSPNKSKLSKKLSKYDQVALHGIWVYEKNGVKYIYGGTTSKIIGTLLELLVSHPDREHIYFLVGVFLNGIRQYYNAAELLTVLLKYWDLNGELNICSGNVDTARSAIVFFLAIWFEKRFVEDFGNGDDSGRPTLEKFLRKLADMYAGPLQAKLKRYIQQEVLAPQILFIKPMSPISGHKLSLLDVKPALVASQWTLLDMRNFQSIPLSEFYARSASDRPEWNRMLQRGDTFTKWIASSIVEQNQISSRVKALKRTIRIASKFVELNNFHGLMCAWGALNSLCVHRLSKTFKKLPRAELDVLKSFEEKLSEANNFSNLRLIIESQKRENTPLIPWFELLSKSRNMLDEYDDILAPKGSSVTRSNRDSVVYSFPKFAKLSEQIEYMTQCQVINRKLDLYSTQNHTSEMLIQNWLSNLQPLDEDELWDLSVQCEPMDILASEAIIN